MDSQKPSSGAAARKEIQAPRPSPLKICRDSRKIRKPAPAVVPAVPMMNRSEPMIIYMHSPKVIHAEVQDFMTLVQRLTGSENLAADDVQQHQPSAPTTSYEPARSAENTRPAMSSKASLNEEIETDRKAASSEPEANEHGLPAPTAVSSVSPNFLFPSPRGLNFSTSFFQDLPLMTPNSDHHFMYSPRDFYRFAEPLFSPPQRPPLNMLQSPSATALDLCNTNPEH